MTAARRMLSRGLVPRFIFREQLTRVRIKGALSREKHFRKFNQSRVTQKREGVGRKFGFAALRRVKLLPKK